MKAATDIVGKIKQLKFEYLKQLYQERLAVKPETCAYNKAVIVHDTKEYKTRVCTYYSGKDNYQICNTVSCAQSCNAYVCKNTKETLKNYLDRDITESPQKYPELTALGWVLDKNEYIQAVRAKEYSFWTRLKMKFNELWGRK